MSTVPGTTIIRETAESSIPRTSKIGRIFASDFLGDLFVRKTGGEGPNNMVNLSRQDGLNLIQAVADALDVEVQVTER